MSAHLTVAEGIAAGFASGVVVATVVAEWIVSRLRDAFEAQADCNAEQAGTIVGQQTTIADLVEELADCQAERDGFRLHLDSVIADLDGSVARHPAGRKLTPPARLRAVGSVSSPAATGPRTVAAGDPTRHVSVTEERTAR